MILKTMSARVRSAKLVPIDLAPSALTYALAPAWPTAEFHGTSTQQIIIALHIKRLERKYGGFVPREIRRKDNNVRNKNRS